MFSIVESLINLVGRVIDNILSWPFLLFIFLVWLVTRFKNQIGSMLDRRGSVPAGELSGKIHKEVNPLSKDLSLIKSQVTDLQFQMRRVEDASSENRQIGALNPIKAKVNILEGQSQKLESLIGDLSAADEKISRTLNPFQDQLKDYMTTLDDFKAKIELAASKDNISSLNSELQKIGEDISTLKNQVNEFHDKIQQAADKEEVSASIKSGISAAEGKIALDTKAKLEPVSQDLSSLKTSVESLQEKIEQLPTADALKAIESETQKSSESMSAVKSQITGFINDLELIRSELQAKPTMDTIDSLKSDLSPLHDQLQTLQEVVEAVQIRLESEPWKEASSSIKTDLESVSKELNKITDQLNTIQNEVKDLAAKEVSAALERDLAPINQELTNVKDSLASVVAKSELDQPDEITRELELLSEEFKDLKSSLKKLQSSGAAKTKKKK